jgi:hypothetical protein
MRSLLLTRATAAAIAQRTIVPATKLATKFDKEGDTTKAIRYEDKDVILNFLLF